MSEENTVTREENPPKDAEEETKEKIELETSVKAQEPQKKETSEIKKEPTEMKEQAKEETQTQATETQLKTAKETQSTVTSEKKSAADRILEEIRRRREMKKQQEQLIDKFLKEQPTIDRTKKPSVEGDLSASAAKEPDLVTEKMAKIYEMQELYDKAIATYKKLILKV
jgi:hypothetical protein